MKDAHNPFEEEIFAEALRLPTPEGRAAYLKQACGDDEPLRRRVEALLHDHDNAGEFLDHPPAAVAAGTIAVSTGMVPLTEKPGDRIGRYKLLEQIGAGGCGVVYVAEQEQPVRRRVALKVIKLGMDTRQVIARFEAERQALALMDHPNIAKVLDGGETETGRPFFVMELVKGVRITDYCDKNNLSTTERLGLFIQVCHAIQHAHQKGVIHRDIKPSNILVTLHDGVPVPKVIDFGIAKATTDQRLTDKTLYTAIEQFIGTPAYMSPEQAELSGLDIDTRSDIYALGVLLYELLTSKTPFDAKRLVEAGLDEIRRIIREEDPPRPSTRISTLDAGEQTSIAKRRHAELPKLLGLVRGDLDWIVMKTLEKDRTRRYETASGLATDIQRHLNNEPVFARPPSWSYLLQKRVRRNKVVFGAVGGVVVLIVAALLAVVVVDALDTQGKAVPRKIVITKKTPAYVNVDLVGLSKSDQEDWRNNVKMDSYWISGSPLRRWVGRGNRIVSTMFEGSDTFVLEMTNPIWTRWFRYGACELAILTNLPGGFDNPYADPRCAFIPLGKKQWISDTIEIEILDSKVRVVTPPSKRRLNYSAATTVNGAAEVAVEAADWDDQAIWETLATNWSQGDWSPAVVRVGPLYQARLDANDGPLARRAKALVEGSAKAGDETK